MEGFVMMRAKSPLVFVLLAALFLIQPTGTLAQDRLGIFFDENYTQNQLELLDLPAMVTGYLVLNEPTSGYPIHGWECCVDVTGPATITSWELEGLTINVLDPPCFMVGIGGDPLPVAENVLLATFQVLITEPTPVIFSVEPVYYSSLPDEMAYLSGPTGDDILPMYPITGIPEVAGINEENPWPELSSESLFFGVQPVGGTTFQNLTVTNVGGGHLYLNVVLPDSVPDFFLPSVSGEHYLAGGASLTIPVGFAPSAIGEITSVLHLGPLVPDVPLHGAGREPVISWDIQGDLNFPDLAVGSQAQRNLIIQNTGEVPIPLAPSLGEGCSGFQLVTPDPVVLEPGGMGIVLVLFEPPYAGEFACDLDLGTILPDVPMTGSAHDPVTSFTVTPDTLVFGEVAVGASRLLEFHVQNTGESTIPLDISLDDPSGYFFLDEIYGQVDLEPGQLKTIEVIFGPQAEGQFTAAVLLGEVVPAVPLYGFGIAPNPSCAVYPEQLEFGPVYVGSGVQDAFSVTNTGNVPLLVEPYEECDHFYISPAPVTIQPGAAHEFTVIFTPMAIGDWECTISLGGTGCPPVHCQGTGEDLPPPGDDDLVGIFFDEAYTDFQGFQPVIGPIEGYLVLKNCSVAAGVLGWECRHEMEGPAILVGAALNGQAVNVGVTPDYIVGLGAPLPPSPDVLLATFTYFIIEPNQEILLYLSPTSVPSIPGYMAFLAGDSYEEILPMFPYTGYEVVAMINHNPLSAQPPAVPQLSVLGGQVQLSWDLPEGQYQGYQVYRREEAGQDTRLTGEPGTISGDRVTFIDRPAGFEPGTVLYYSYTLISAAGVESPRSPEVEFEVPDVPAQVTRLLPSVPNPFNPRTRIRFAVAEAGPVRVAIYDVTGRLIRDLVSESMNAGSHEEVWQGRDNNGRQVPSGAYYVRLVTPDGTDSRKIMLLK
jgi:hypothetical protein